MAMNRRVFLGLVAASLVAVCGAAQGPEPICFDAPAPSDRGAMLLGNGEVCALAWVSADGTLHSVLQRSDSWNEAGRHVKVGQIDYVTERPVEPGTFRQTFTKHGVLTARWTCGGKPVTISYRIQHGNAPLTVCHVEGAEKAQAKVVNWRLYPGGTKRFGVTELDNRFVEGSHAVAHISFVVNADRLLPDGWCHVNRNETVKEMMGYYDAWQATGDLGKRDPLSNRVFGALTRTDRKGDEALFVSAVTCLQPCASVEAWRKTTADVLASSGWTLAGEVAALSRHQKGWDDFWARSWITLSPNREVEPPRVKMPLNPKLPLSYAHDSYGGTLLKGRIRPAADNIFTSNLIRFAATFTTSDVKSNQRLVDNITPGSRDGFLVDLHEGRVRSILGQQTLYHSKPVTAGVEHAVALTVSERGEILLTFDGDTLKASMDRSVAVSSAEACARVQQAWHWQRYVTACAGRGTWPIRFNGSLFTTAEKGDPDYRRWGHGYWWQNTRLPYYPMLVAGDGEEMQPLFKLYFSLLEFNLRRTRKYLNHAGAYFPECVQPWGDHFVGSYGTKPWAQRKDKLQDSTCHKYEWVGQLELSLMALDYRDFTLDDAWFREEALPSIREYVRYFDAHYALGADGHYDWQPAQALETYQDCTNPMTEVAGLTRVTERLLALPESLVSAADRALFAKIHARLPPLPTKTLADGSTVFTPAAKWGRYSNVETPELYCVFPFRLCSFEKPTAAIGRRTYETRRQKTYRGWNQDELFAAYLGLAHETRMHLVNRVVNNRDPAFRWPTYWRPNFDWRPDQCAGGNIQNMLQSMLLQWDGKRIFLMPAWPKDWDGAFRLHAPYQTVIEGAITKGKLTLTRVTPEARRADIVICPAQ